MLSDQIWQDQWVKQTMTCTHHTCIASQASGLAASGHPREDTPQVWWSCVGKEQNTERSRRVALFRLSQQSRAASTGEAEYERNSISPLSNSTKRRYCAEIEWWIKCALREVELTCDSVGEPMVGFSTRQGFWIIFLPFSPIPPSLSRNILSNTSIEP